MPIKVNETENLVSNAEGYFTYLKIIVETKQYLAFLLFVNRQLTVSELKRLNYSILLTSGIFQLNDVKVSNENRTLMRLWPTLMLT
jgi:hypothetical protein